MRNKYSRLHACIASELDDPLLCLHNQHGKLILGIWDGMAQPSPTNSKSSKVYIIFYYFGASFHVHIQFYTMVSTIHAHDQRSLFSPDISRKQPVTVPSLHRRG